MHGLINFPLRALLWLVVGLTSRNYESLDMRKWVDRVNNVQGSLRIQWVPNQCKKNVEKWTCDIISWGALAVRLLSLGH